MTKMKIACIVPAWNEEKNIEKTINSLRLLVDSVIVVNDCSTDKTGIILSKINNPRVVVFHHPINLGQGAALQTGNDYAIKNNYDIIVHFDADGQFQAEDIKKITKPLIDSDYDIVFGSRFLNIKSSIPYFKRTVILPLAKTFNYLFFGIKTSDPQNGFRAMSLNAAKKIRIENNRMAHCTEILAKAFKYKLKIKEIPIKVIYTEFGQKFSGGLSIIKDLFLKKIIN